MIKRIYHFDVLLIYKEILIKHIILFDINKIYFLIKVFNLLILMIINQLVMIL